MRQPSNKPSLEQIADKIAELEVNNEESKSFDELITVMSMIFLFR